MGTATKTTTSGIDPKRAYTVKEFSAITGIDRRKLSRIRRTDARPNGLIIRDAGVPTILGADYLQFVAGAALYEPKLRGRHKPNQAKPVTVTE